MLIWLTFMLHISFNRVTVDTVDSIPLAVGVVRKNQDDFAYLCGTSEEIAERLSSAGPFSFLHLYIFKVSSYDLSRG